jgi:phosphoglycolate phosphatase
LDLDGTLIDSTPGIHSSLAAAFEAAGRAMPPTDLRRIIGPPITVIARRIEPSLTDDEVLIIERIYRKLYDSEGWRQTVAFESVDATLKTLQATGKQLFIVTNKPKIPTGNILATLGLNMLFTESLTRDSRTPHFASKAEMVNDILSRHRLAPESIVMVGDTIEDQESAHAHGLRFLHARYGFGAIPDASHPIDNFSEVLSLLA